MGGKALKNTTTQRLDRGEFERVSARVAQVLRERFPGARVAVIPAYASKADFGDLDILLESEPAQAAGGTEALVALARDVFHTTDLFKNGNVLSFDYRETAAQTEPGFQVDVITMHGASFEFALNYFSFNDLGNLMGRTAHKQGCSFGHDGLWYYFRDGDYKFREVLLTRDFDTALVAMGYEPARFHQGFEGLEDIFQYVAGSAYFNRDIFLLENRNHQSRVRDRKRKTYTEFLKWCEAHPGLAAYPYPADKREWLAHLFAHFLHFRGEYDQAQVDLERQRRVKLRFNGEFVRALTGLEDRALGELMRRFKERFASTEALHEHVLSRSVEELGAEVLALHRDAR